MSPNGIKCSPENNKELRVSKINTHIREVRVDEGKSFVKYLYKTNYIVIDDGTYYTVKLNNGNSFSMPKKITTLATDLEEDTQPYILFNYKTKTGFELLPDTIRPIARYVIQLPKNYLLISS